MVVVMIVCDDVLWNSINSDDNLLQINQQY